MEALFVMQTVGAASCTYCGTSSQWSAERSDTTEIGEEYTCPTCERSTTVWEGEGSDSLEAGSSMDWVHPDPLD